MAFFTILMNMGLPDKLPIILSAIALVISIVVALCSIWLTHYFAIRQFRVQQVETEIEDIWKALNQLDLDLKIFGDHIRQHQMDFGNSSNVFEPNKRKFAEIYKYGIHEDIITDVTRLRKLNFFVLCRKKFKKVHAALQNFHIRQEELTDDGKCQRIGDCFFTHGTTEELSSISRDDIRQIVESFREKSELNDTVGKE